MPKPETNRLRVVRAERRVTQLALARKSQINATRISFIENGHVEPTASERDRIARALRVSVEIVFPPNQEAAAS
jgi:transcriptional regulator with XRE-family HTH domain